MKKFLEGFDLEMAYQLMEREPKTLEQMQKNVLSIKANPLAKKAKIKTKRRVTFREEPSSSLDTKLDMVVKSLEKMVEKMSITDRTSPRENAGGP